MADKATILAWLDKAIATLAVLVDMIPGKIDDLALSFLEWARNDETFLGWLDRFEPPAPNAMSATPEVLLDSLRRWRDETGSTQAASTGDFMQLVGLILQIVQWIQKRKGAAPTG